MPIREVPLSDPAVEPLLDWIRSAYTKWYGGPDEVDAAEFEPPDGAFLVLVDGDGRTVAGGGIRRIEDGLAEVKRVWTAPEARRRGHAATVLRALEATARD